jgi:hypothetical protein
MRDVALEERARVDRPPDPGGGTPGQLVGAEHERLEILLGVVGQLLAGRVEHLEAVVLGRVVGGGDHDPGGEPALAGEERERRGRHDANRVDVHAHARGAGRDRGDEHVAGRRVSWPTTSEPPAPTTSWAVARPSAKASDGRRSTLAAPRMPSVPNRRVMWLQCVSGPTGRNRGQGVAEGASVGRRRRTGSPWRRVAGCGARGRRRAGRRHGDGHLLRVDRDDLDTGRDHGHDRDGVLAGPRPSTFTPDHERPRGHWSRSATEPNSVSSTWFVERAYVSAAFRPSSRSPALKVRSG